MAPAAAISIYGKLTIGDGLVAQVPALLISLATGILVSRGSRGENLPQRIADQLLYRPVIFSPLVAFWFFLSLPVKCRAFRS